MALSDSDLHQREL